MAIGIVVKNYEHFNKSLPNWDSKDGKYISSKAHYEREMAKGGFVPYKPVEQKQSKWTPSADLQKTLYQVKQMGDKNGKIVPTDKLINKMKSMGVSFNPSFMPKEK